MIDNVFVKKSIFFVAPEHFNHCAHTDTPASDVLVRVEAAGVNNTHLNTRLGVWDGLPNPIRFGDGRYLDWQGLGVSPHSRH